MSSSKRKLAPGNCSHCGANEQQTSLWRTNPINRERLCNACGLYVQTHGRPRPIGHFAGKKRMAPPPVVPIPPPPPNAASSSRPAAAASTKSPRVSNAQPSNAVGSSSGSGLTSSEDESDEDSDDAPASRSARGPRGPRLPRAEASAATSKPRAPRPPPKARSPPPVPVSRPRSAPPSKPSAASKPPNKRKTKKTNSPSLDIFLADKVQNAVAPDVAFLRQAAPAVPREAATDVMIGGKMHRLPEQSIKLDFWTKALGLHSGPSAEAAKRGAASLPSFSPRQALLSPSSEFSSPSNSPSLSIENTFGTSGGDFGHLGRSSSSSGKKRSRIRLEDPAYDGPLFGQSSKASGSGSGALSGGMGGMQIGRKVSSPVQSTSNKRPRSESRSPNTSPTLSHASPVLLSSSASHLSVAAGNLPRASSPLRTSFTLPLPVPHVYPRSHLGTEMVTGSGGASPSPVNPTFDAMVTGL